MIDMEAKQERLAEQARALKHAYYAQNEAFWLYLDVEYHPPKHEIDDPYYGLYLCLAYYGKETGMELTYAQIYDYLSQEYEDDGEIRIYTNGRHPEIARYVEWYQNENNKEGYFPYTTSLMRISSDYWASRGIEFVPVQDDFRNTAVMDELIKKEADPSYVMNDEIMLAHLGGVKD